MIREGEFDAELRYEIVVAMRGELLMARPVIIDAAVMSMWVSIKMNIKLKRFDSVIIRRYRDSWREPGSFPKSPAV